MHSAYWHMKTPQSNEFIWWGILFAVLHSIDDGFFHYMEMQILDEMSEIRKFW